MRGMTQTITHITENIYQIHIPVPFPLKVVHCYLVREDDGWVMIDTGLQHPRALEAWDHTFGALGMTARDLRRIYITHAHPDHYGLAGHFQRLSAAPVYALDQEIRVIPIEWEADGSHMYMLADFFKTHGAPRPVVESVTTRSLQVLSMVQPQPVLTPLHDGDTVTLGGYSYRVIWMPGHADGHLLLHRADGLVFVGDHILMKITPNIALWPRLDPNPLRNYLASLEKTARLSVRIALPGHRAPITDMPTRVKELERHHDVRAQACLDATDAACTAYEACLRIFPKLESVDDVRMAMVETMSHLEYLVHAGKVERAGKDSILYQRVEGG